MAQQVTHIHCPGYADCHMPHSTPQRAWLQSRALGNAIRRSYGRTPFSSVWQKRTYAWSAFYGVFRPLEPVVLPEGEHVQVRVPEGPPIQHERLAALEAFEAISEELTKEQWNVFEEAVQRRPWFGGRQLDL